LALLNKFLVGCDPEFVAYDKAGALLVLPMDHDGPIGIDHGGDVAELHPEPSKDTRTLTLRLKRIILSEPLQAEGIGKLRAGALPKWQARALINPNRMYRQMPIGGHVHLDLTPYEHDDMRVFSTQHNLRVKALDKFTKCLETLDILPREESEHRRGEMHGYGRFGDVRVPGAGGYLPQPPFRTEYRTMASWLFHPKTTFLCLTGAKLCAVDPQAALDALGLRPGYMRLRRIFEYFGDDVNAKRVSERVLGVGVKSVQFPVDVDFREAWKVLM